MSPQLRVYRLGRFATIAEEFVIVTIANKATLFIGDQTVFTLGNKTLTYSLYICRIETTVVGVAIMQLCMGSCWFRLLASHFHTLVIGHYYGGSEKSYHRP